MVIWKLLDPVLWNLAAPDEPTPAVFTWEWKRLRWKKLDERDGLCPECKDGPRYVQLPGTTIEWLPGADTITDFVWDEGGDTLLLTDCIYQELVRRFGGFSAGPVHMIQNPKLKRPARLTKRTKPRIWLPYQGPMLHELWITAYIPLDMERSTLRLVRNCSTCGAVRYRVEGVEWVESGVEILRDAKGEIAGYRDTPTHRPRQPGGGMYVRSEHLQGVDIFRASQFDGWMLCTDRVKQFIEDRGFKNIAFWEMGEVI